MNAASAVVALSDISRQQMIERGVDPAKIVVIPNAVDEELIDKKFQREAIREELKLPVNVKIVGTVTAVVDYEGLDCLVRALALLPSEWRGLVVGDGTSLPGLKELATDLGVRDRIDFVGKKPSTDIWKWYAVLDVFAVPRRDTRVTRVVTPIKPLIAMALGIPVVASDLPALREVTGDKAQFFTASAPEELAASILSAFHGRKKLQETDLRTRTWRANSERFSLLFREQTAS